MPGSIEELDIAAFDEAIDLELAEAAEAEAAAARADAAVATDGQTAAVRLEDEIEEDAEDDYAAPGQYPVDECDADEDV